MVTRVIGTPWGATTLAYETATGNQVWVGRYDGPRGMLQATAGHQMALAPDGSRLFITGYGQETGDELFDPSVDPRWGIVFAYDL